VIVVLDNLSAHKPAAARGGIRSMGAEPPFVLPHREAFSKLTPLLKKAAARLPLSTPARMNAWIASSEPVINPYDRNLL
jgi:hypothetical protein